MSKRPGTPEPVYLNSNESINEIEKDIDKVRDTLNDDVLGIIFNDYLDDDKSSMLFMDILHEQTNMKKLKKKEDGKEFAITFATCKEMPWINKKYPCVIKYAKGKPDISAILKGNIVYEPEFYINMMKPLKNRVASCTYTCCNLISLYFAYYYKTNDIEPLKQFIHLMRTELTMLQKPSGKQTISWFYYKYTYHRLDIKFFVKLVDTLIEIGCGDIIQNNKNRFIDYYYHYQIYSILVCDLHDNKFMDWFINHCHNNILSPDHLLRIYTCTMGDILKTMKKEEITNELIQEWHEIIKSIIEKCYNDKFREKLDIHYFLCNEYILLEIIEHDIAYYLNLFKTPYHMIDYICEITVKRRPNLELLHKMIVNYLMTPKSKHDWNIVRHELSIKFKRFKRLHERENLPPIELMPIIHELLNPPSPPTDNNE